MNFPDSPMFAGINMPCRIEADINDLEIEGELLKLPLRLKPAYHGSWSDARFVKPSALL